MDTILLIIAIILLAAGLLVKGYGMVQLANKNIPEAERMARYKKTLPLSYAMLLPLVLIVVYFVLTK